MILEWMAVAQLQNWKEHQETPKTMGWKSVPAVPHKVAGSSRSQVKVGTGMTGPWVCEWKWGWYIYREANECKDERFISCGIGR